MLLRDMARQEMWCGDPETALTYVEMALARADRVRATERAMASTDPGSPPGHTHGGFS